MEPENLDNSTGNETGAVDIDSSKKSILDILNNDTEEKADDKTEDTTESTSDDDSESTGESTEDAEEETEEFEEEPEEQVEEEEKEEEPEELTASFGNLNKAYPDIFKKFPSLRNKLGREYAFSDIYPTLDEARLASQKAEVYDQYEVELQKGNPDAFVKALPDLKTAAKFAEEILPALRRAHPDLYTKAVDPFARLLLNKMHNDATAANDKNLALAAKYVSRYLYGKAEIPALPQKRNDEPDPEKEELKSQLAQERAIKAQNFEISVTSAVTRVLNKEAKSLFDPKDSLPPKAQTVWINQIITELDEELKQNPTHMARMRAFKDRALKSGLSDSAKSQILSAYLQNARPLLKTISQRIKSEAFGKKNGIVKEEQVNSAKRTEGRKVIPSSSVTNKQPIISSKVDAKNVKQFKAKGGQMEDILGG